LKGDFGHIASLRATIVVPCDAPFIFQFFIEQLRRNL